MILDQVRVETWVEAHKVACTCWWDFTCIELTWLYVCVCQPIVWLTSWQLPLVTSCCQDIVTCKSIVSRKQLHFWQGWNSQMLVRLLKMQLLKMLLIQVPSNCSQGVENSHWLLFIRTLEALVHHIELNWVNVSVVNNVMVGHFVSIVSLFIRI